MRKVIASVAILLLAAAAFAGKGTIEERLKPVGDICMAGEACAAPVQVVASGPARSGADVYQTKCATCHTTGAAGAPKLGDAGAWETRLGNGIEALYANAINGINGMPAKGLCFDCSDGEIQSAVDYMLEGSQ